MPRKKKLPKTPGKKFGPHRYVMVPSTVHDAWLRAHVQKHGGDPASVPKRDFRLMRPKEVIAELRVHPATFWKMVRQNKYPRPIPMDLSGMDAAVREEVVTT